MTDASCWAHARRKPFEAHAFNGSEIAGHAVTRIAVDALRSCLTTKRQRLSKVDAMAKAIDDSLSHWMAHTHFLDSGNVPIGNNAAENFVRPFGMACSQYPTSLRV